MPDQNYTCPTILNSPTEQLTILYGNLQEQLRESDKKNLQVNL